MILVHVNVISPGHMNVKAVDIVIGAGGAIEMFALGKKNVMGLIKDPVSTIGIKIIAGGLTLLVHHLLILLLQEHLHRQAATTVTAATYTLTSAGALTQ